MNPTMKESARTALCIWEEMLSRRAEALSLPVLQAATGRETAPGIVPVTESRTKKAEARVASYGPMLRMWEAVGAGVMRDTALELAPYVESVYAAVPPQLLDCYAFDWEIVPAILDLVPWGDNGGTLPSPDTAARAVVAALVEVWPDDSGEAGPC